MYSKTMFAGFGACALAGAILFAAGPAQADGSVAGKYAAAASLSEQSPLTEWPDNLLTATIAKGKKRRMLLIHASLTYNGLDATVLGLDATVNGVGVEPEARSVMYCTNQLCDSVTGSWWLDLDNAESQHPGQFINKPLVVQLIGGEITGGGTVTLDDGVWTASLSVQMVKK